MDHFKSSVILPDPNWFLWIKMDPDGSWRILMCLDRLLFPDGFILIPIPVRFLMDQDGSKWILTDYDKFWWMLMDPDWYQWILMDKWGTKFDLDGSRWIQMDSYQSYDPDWPPWIHMDYKQSQWILLDPIGSQCIPMDPEGSQCIHLSPSISIKI